MQRDRTRRAGAGQSDAEPQTPGSVEPDAADQVGGAPTPGPESEELPLVYKYFVLGVALRM